VIGEGDWNDSTDRVGHQGPGESVWRARFLAVTLEAFAGVCLDRATRNARNMLGSVVHRASDRQPRQL
jgi:cellobiose phosphorylase